MVSVNKILIKIDQGCDLVPFVSTATNFGALMFKVSVASGCISKTFVRKNSFAKHLCKKSKLQCVTLLVPRYGNLVFVVYKLFKFALDQFNTPPKKSKPTAEQQRQLDQIYRTQEEIQHGYQQLQQRQQEVNNMLYNPSASVTINKAESEQVDSIRKTIMDTYDLFETSAKAFIAESLQIFAEWRESRSYLIIARKCTNLQIFISTFKSRLKFDVHFAYLSVISGAARAQELKKKILDEDVIQLRRAQLGVLKSELISILETQIQEIGEHSDHVTKFQIEDYLRKLQVLKNLQV